MTTSKATAGLSPVESPPRAGCRMLPSLDRSTCEYVTSSPEARVPGRSQGQPHRERRYHLISPFVLNFLEIFT